MRRPAVAAGLLLPVVVGLGTLAPSLAQPRVAASPTRVEVPVGYVRRYRHDGEFVAELGDAVLVRRDHTADEGTYLVLDLETGEARATIPWLSSSLPFGERTYTHRFTFAGDLVSVVEGTPPSRTSVYELASGTRLLSRPAPQAVRLVARALRTGSPATRPDVLALVADGRVLRALDARTGATRWKAVARHAHTEVLFADAEVVVSFEAHTEANGEVTPREGVVTVRRTADGRRLHDMPLSQAPYAPVLVARDADAVWLAQDTTLVRLDRHASGDVRRATTSERVDALHLVGALAVVHRIDATTAAYDATLTERVALRGSGYGCVVGGGPALFGVRGFDLLERIASATEGPPFARGGFPCGWQFTMRPLEGSRGDFLVTRPDGIERWSPTDATVAAAPLRVHGTVTLDGRPVAELPLTLAGDTTETDAAGRFDFEVRALGRFGLRLSTMALEGFAAPRCVRLDTSIETIDHDGSVGTREVAIALSTFAPNELTGCAPM